MGNTEDGASEHTDGSQSRKRNQKPNVVGTIRQEFTIVTAGGIPVQPERYATGYGRQVAAILRNTVPITTSNLRTHGNSHYCQLLVDKLHTRYKFPDPFNNKNLKGNKVNKAAPKKMSTALASWRVRVKNAIFKENKSWEELKEKEPLIDEPTYDLFKARCESEDAKAASDKGKEMRKLNIGNHRLGAGGYRSSKPKWDKEDAELRAAGKPNPFDKYTDPQTKNFLRARFHVDKATSALVSNDDKVKEFEAAVVSNLPRI